MKRQSISITKPNTDWLERKVIEEGEFRSNSDAINDLIRQAREREVRLARMDELGLSGKGARLVDELLR